MICQLCLQDKKLCKKSHIIPDFMHQELFDEKHRLVKFDPSMPNSNYDVPTGEYEGNILCEDCDNRVIGQYESYTKMVLYGGKLAIKIQGYHKPDGLEFIQVTGLDYQKFKLFQLSLLWKASISNRPFFDSVRLGPYEDKLRNMILNEDPGPSSFFPCIITSLRKYNTSSMQIIASPKKVRLDKKIGYNFLVSGMNYIYKITENETKDWIMEAVINENGEMKIPHVPEDKANEIVNRLFGIK